MSDTGTLWGSDNPQGGVAPMLGEAQRTKSDPGRTHSPAVPPTAAIRYSRASFRYIRSWSLQYLASRAFRTSASIFSAIWMNFFFLRKVPVN